jgi:phospholipid/cholesterol/gamma-HCH transport system substrate-binding protein
METKGNYFIVGVFTMVLSLALVFFLAWLMGYNQLSSSYKKLLIYFPSNVSGLSEGSQVAYRGVQIGKVSKIKLDPNLPQYALVMAHISTNTPLRLDTRAVMGNVGITGLAYVELETENNHSPELQPVPGKDYYMLLGTQSRLEQLLQDVPKLIDKYTQVANQLLSLFDNKNINATASALDSLDKFMHNLVGQQDNFNKIISDTRDTIYQFKVNTGSSFNRLNNFLQEGTDAAKELKGLTKEIEENPSGLIFQPKYNGYHIQK